MCPASGRAEHPFARYMENSKLVVMHFEYLRCGDQHLLCGRTGCLHQVYISERGRYRLLRSYYTNERD
jgi:hypothetical protein